MTDKQLNQIVEEEVQEQDARGEAVRALVNVDSKNDLHTNVETRTDLTENDVKAHSVIMVLDKFLGGDTILKDLIVTRERKLISKDRKSRAEIVEVARNPDTTNIMGGEQNPGLLKRFFTSRDNKGMR